MSRTWALWTLALVLQLAAVALTVTGLVLDSSLATLWGSTFSTLGSCALIWEMFL